MTVMLMTAMWLFIDMRDNGEPLLSSQTPGALAVRIHKVSHKKGL